MKILITYASEQGSTQSIAEHMHARISALNLGDVIIAPVTPPPSLDGVDAVIIGACIHTQAWIMPGYNFVEHELKAFQKESPDKPVWAFSVGMPPQCFGLKEIEEAKIERWLKKHIQIRGHTLFAGRYRKEGMPTSMRVVLTCLRVKIEDRRDWGAIDQWTDKVVAELKPQEAESMAA